MTLTLRALNALPGERAEAELHACCGSRRWTRAMARRRPFGSRAVLLRAADEIWWSLGPADWREAFASHPRIGERAAGAAGASAAWSAAEQAGVDGAAARTMERLAEGNRAYERRFGHIFIVCATGRGAEEMLGELEARLRNDPDTECRIAAEEQRRITRLRLEKLLDAEESER